jgi:serine phosphatase RsbU (regulator of sigma subunit)
MSAPATAAVQALLGRLLDEAHVIAPDDLLPLLQRELEALEFSEVVVYLVDHEQRGLVPLPPSKGEAIGIEGSLAGRVYQTASTALAGAEPVRLWQVIRDGVDRLGVLMLARASFDDDLVAACRQLAALVAQLLLSKNQLTDEFVVARRSREMALGAEIRWGSLPPLSFSCERVSVAAALEPAHEVSGDAFDYALNGDVLHVGIFDGMGHELESSLLTDLTVAAYRHARRRGSSVEEMYLEIDQLLRDRFDDGRFVTAQLAVLDVEGGELRLLNAGHPGPLLVRRGRVINLRGRRVALPLGLGDVGDADADQQIHALEPGDRLLFYTDGLTEARAPDGSQFGEERLVDTIERACSDQHPPAEAVRRLMHTLGEFRDHEWHDDASIVMVQWPASES